MFLSLDEMIELEFELQEAEWRSYESLSAEFKARVNVVPPDERLTREQIRARLVIRATVRNSSFSMRDVTTGARRSWKR